MGEAKRRRDAIGKEIGTAIDTTSGASLRARYGGRLSEFLSGLKLDKPNTVPCNGCNACCYHSHIDVDPAKERAEDLAHLELVPYPTGGLALRKREDGACFHLGPSGCTVYAHRPRACRCYDCRVYSAIGVIDTYDGDRHSPAWGFDRTTVGERVYEMALRLAAAKHMATEANWNSNTVLVAAFGGFAEMLPKAEVLIARFENLPPAEREKIISHIEEYFTKQAA
jgi:hypothetical protein